MSQTSKEKFNVATDFIKGALAVPVLGLVAHAGVWLFHAHQSEDYSLSNRFETAYSFNAPQEHSYYHGNYDANYLGVSQGEHFKQRYLATPWATYPAMLIMGLAGIAQGKEDRKKKNAQIIAQQHTR